MSRCLQSRWSLPPTFNATTDLNVEVQCTNNTTQKLHRDRLRLKLLQFKHNCCHVYRTALESFWEAVGSLHCQLKHQQQKPSGCSSNAIMTSSRIVLQKMDSLSPTTLQCCGIMHPWICIKSPLRKLSKTLPEMQLWWEWCPMWHCTMPFGICWRNNS